MREKRKGRIDGGSKRMGEKNKRGIKMEKRWKKTGKRENEIEWERKGREEEMYWNMRRMKEEE